MGSRSQLASLGDGEHQPSGDVLVKAQDFLPPLHAKRQRCVRCQLEQGALHETTGR